MCKYNKPEFTIYFFSATVSMQKEIKKVLFKYRKYFTFVYDEMNHHIQDKVGISCTDTNESELSNSFNASSRLIEDLFELTEKHNVFLDCYPQN